MNKIYTTTIAKKQNSFVGSFTKNIFLLLVGLMGICGYANSQVTVSPGPATNYGTLKLAFDAINAGTHTGALTVSINATTTETATALLNSSGTGAASYTSILIKPTATATIGGSIAGALVKLNGSDGVTIDGFIGAGPARSLTFTNTNTSTSSAVIWVASASSSDGAINNIVQNCVITGSGNLNTLAALLSSSGTTLGGVAEAANRNNTYQNNAVSAAQYGIALVGPTGNESNNIISNNLVGSVTAASKIGFRGIAIFQQQDVLISQNTIFGVAGATGGLTVQTSGIFVAGTISGGLIERNSISDVSIVGFWGCNGIQLQSTTPATNLTIANNFIYNIFAGGFTTADSVDDGDYGIAVNTGGGYKIYYNSIDLSTNQTGTPGISAAFWTSLSVGSANLDVRNNIFSNRQTTGTRYAIWCNTNSNTFTNINYNDYFSSGSVGFLSSARATLAAWQSATTQDANSVAINPGYTSTSNLHLIVSSPLDGIAGTGTGIAIDYDNQARNGTTPDIGADEFTPPVCSATTGGTANANPSSLCTSGTATLSATGFAFGLGISYMWQMWNGAAWVDMGQTNPNSATTGVISATTKYRLKVTCPACCGATPGFSSEITVIATTPQVTGSAGATRCGTGTLNLTATGTGPLYWYTVSSGGAAIGTGSPFTTPPISATTTYYVGVTNGGTPEAGGMPNSTGADGSFLTTGWGVVFDATSAFTLTSAVIYPTGTGTVTIGLYDASGTELTASPAINVTGTGIATPVTLPLGFTVPIGSGYRLLIKNFTGITNLIRDFTTAFPYPSPSGALVVGSGWNGGITTANYFFYNLMIASGCESTPRVAVTATVTNPPVFSAGPTASPAAICSGQSSNLSVASANPYSYVWTPGPLPGANVTVSPTTTTTYTVTATDGTPCVRVATVTVTVNPSPTTLTVTPVNASICINTPQLITASGGLLPNQTIFSELFEVYPTTQFANYGTGITDAQNGTYYQQGNNSVQLTNGDLIDGGIAMTNNINLTLYSSPVLTFYHICAEEKTFDFGYVQYSTDGGTNWQSFLPPTYTGTGVLKNGVVSFDASSYTDWNSVFTVPGSTPGISPATSLWKLETINLAGFQTSSQFRVRFRVQSDISLAWYGWLIDNVQIKGTGQGAVTWTPNTNLYSSIGPNIPYVLGTPDSTVYAILPSGSQVYTATVGSGCTSVATSTLVTASLPVSVSVASNLGPSVCTGASIILTATVTNGGANPSFTWKKNTVTVYSGTGMAFSTYAVSNPANFVSGDVYTCEVLSSAGGCTSYPTGSPPGTPPALSNNLTMTVNTYPTVTISGSLALCNGTPTNLTSVHSGGANTYQWNLNTGAIGGANLDNWGAIAPGDYTLTVTANGCPTISNILTLAYTTNNITVTAGANGTITPVGPTVVNCGFNQAYTITPNAGYSICPGTGVLIDGVADAGAIGSGTYTFTNVTAPHTISATFCIVGCVTPATSNANTSAVNSTCGNVNYTLSGSVGGSANPNLSSWSSSSGGTFFPNNAYLTATSYTPSATDITNGSVTLTLTTNDPDAGGPCLASSSSMTLTVKPFPGVNITGLLGICPASNTTLTASTSFPSGTITGYQWFNGATPLGTASTQLVSATGNYSVTVTGSNACTNTDAVAIVNFAPPTISISGAIIICTNSTVTLTASATAGSGTIGGTSYQWTKGGIDQPGETGPVYVANSAGIYGVRVTNSNGCTTTSATHTITVDNSALIGSYTIGAGPASCTNYVSFSSGFNDLNKRGVGGIVRFDIPAGYTETAPVGGLMLGSNVTTTLSSSLSAANTLIFQKSGGGANPKINAYVGTQTPASVRPDGIVHLKGVSYVTFDAIDLNDGNVANPQTMEYGYGLFKTSVTNGSRNNTIQNCVITMSRANGTAGTAPMPDGSHGILVLNATDSAATTAIVPTSAAGTNSNNKFYSDSIKNSYSGIALMGYAAPSPFTLGDTGNDIGGNSPATGNIILNYGLVGASNAANAIRASNQWGLNISYNTINNNNGAGVFHNNVLRGIYAESGTSASATINNNTITTIGNAGGSASTAIENGIGSTPNTNTVLISNNIITGANALGAAWTAISSTSTAATVNINGNTVQNATLAGAGAWTGIGNTGAATNVNINSNTIQGINLTTTGAFTAINNTAAVTTLTIDGNIINNNLRTAASTTAINLINVGSAVTPPTTVIVTNNTISNNTMAAGGSNFTFSCIQGNIAASTVSDNTMYNNGVTGISGTGVATLHGYSNIVANTFNETISNNIVRKLYVTGTSTGLQVIRGFHHAVNTASSRTLSGNLIDTLYCTSTVSSSITGINSVNGATITIFKNKIQSLYPGMNTITPTPGSFVKGIAASVGTVNIYNNIVNIDLATAFAPAANSVLTGADAAKGIEIAGATAANIFYNTIRMNGAGSGAAFTNTGLGITSTTPVVTIKDNIIDNLMSNGGAAAGSVAFRRTGGAIDAKYATTSNNNLFWSGTPSATNLLYFDGTNSAQTLAVYQGLVGMSPRETNSVSFAPLFMSATDLRPNPSANCAADGQGTPITVPFAITDDYAAVPRDAVLPDIGAYEFTGSGGTPTWRGLSTDWMNVNNWCGVLPTVTTDVVIPAGVSFFPIITTTAPVAKSITIAASATMTINAGGAVFVKGDFANSGTLVNNGRIILNGTTSQNFPGAVGTISAMDTLEVNNVGGGANINKVLTITGALLPTSGTITLNANNITLRSTATKTANVGVVGTTNAFVYNSTGRFVVERYIATGVGGSLHGKTWQFLAIPTKGDFIKTSWMENNLPAGNTGPVNFGTIITSEKTGAVGRGYDFVTAPGPSMKTYNPTTNGWNSVDDNVTNTSAKLIENQQGYMVFVRGDRSVTTSGAAATPTTLRTTGRLYAPGADAPLTTNVTANKFESIGNPYASAIDFTTLGRTGGVDNAFYVWDPSLSGALGFGGYQTISSAGGWIPSSAGTTNYPAATVVQKIQSGQAFFVHATTNPGTVPFAEANKTTGNRMVNKPGPVADRAYFRAALYSGTNNTANIADGNVVSFDFDFSDIVDGDDALKLMNTGENFAITRDGNILAIEARRPVMSKDTIFYYLTNLRQQTYEFRFTPQSINVGPHIQAFLVDKFLKKRTLVSLGHNSTHSFVVNSKPGSYAEDRFMIVFKRARQHSDEIFTNVDAIRQDKDILVSWNVSDEEDISFYEVEKSLDGNNFSKMNEQASKENPAAAQYSWIDSNPQEGDNFYRIHSVGIGGQSVRSKVVKVNIAKLPPAITVFPNPVQEDRAVYVSMTSKPAGDYNLVITNSKGQQVMSKTINHTGVNNVYTITMDKLKTHGTYLLTITGDDKVNSTFKIVY